MEQLHSFRISASHTCHILVIPSHVSHSGHTIARVTFWRCHRTCHNLATLSYCHILVTPSHVSHSGGAIARVTFWRHRRTCNLLATSSHVSHSGDTTARVTFRWRFHHWL